MIDGVMLALLVALSGGTTADSGGPAGSQPASQPASRPGEPLKIRPGERIAAMGDSITQAGGYLRVIDEVLARQYPELKIPKVINAGISGQKAEDMVKRFEQDVVARKPDIVTISVGINDVWHRLEQPHDPKVLEEFGRNLDRMVQMAQDAGARVIVLSPTVIMEDPASEGNRRLKLYIKAGREIARKRRCQYVNLHEMFLKVIRNRQRLQAGRPDEHDAHQLTTDGVHMKPLGDTLMAVGVLRALGVPDEKISATDLSGVFPKQ
ncbi:MAG: SGNH/GDSL hydrolase family protein [Planctomycetes bacterium]|nr:SGNH/GDSL hydrolase family protein [Planctomycetota bacterium]